ncbi:hypothetical protein [Deinococcus multiflagellatus]|uniref:HAD family hydrolase n=1 Tax=Deinococcus multiflagellatus TaxID=1656887 RepID=A0ABW1ZRU4_9DEIO|nr:hypothetical protein [Deinococcus multiflagellatus]MBZ9716061.1 hypothetical protein [Deinococcus multiflagellatus]
MLTAFINPLGLLYDPSGTAESPGLASGVLDLLQGATLVPVTGLGEDELLAVPAAFTSWQVLAHGAVVLTPEGEEDAAWRRLTREAQAEAEAALTLGAQAAGHLNALEQLGLEVTVTERHGRPLLVQLRHPYGLTRALDQARAGLLEWLQDAPFRQDLRLTRDPLGLTLLPSSIRPERAVNYLLSLWSAPGLTVGVSALADDRPFLALCDTALVPGASLLGTPEPDPEE